MTATKNRRLDIIEYLLDNGADVNERDSLNILTVSNIIPENEIKFEEELENYDFTRSQSLRLKKIMGYDKRRVVKSGTTVSDLIIFGFKHMFDKDLIRKISIRKFEYFL